MVESRDRSFSEIEQIFTGRPSMVNFKKRPSSFDAETIEESANEGVNESNAAELEKQMQEHDVEITLQSL